MGAKYVPDLQAKVTALEAATRSAQSAGDNAWMLVSAALVLMMTGPGLALFYGGLVRRKNVLGTMMQSFILMAVVTVLWAVVGYSLAFGEGLAVHRRLALCLSERRGQRAQRRLRGHHPAPDLHDLPVDVRDHHAGADLRRFRRAHEVQRHAAVHDAVDADRVLPDGAHGLGQGRIPERGPGRQDPLLRFRRRHGGAHHFRRFGAGLRAVSGQAPGLSARIHEAAQPGAELHWRVPAVGGLVRIQRRQRAGGLQPGDQRFVATHFAAAAAALGWMLAEWLTIGQAQRAGRHLRCVAGLVAITPASGFVKPFPALLIGFLAGIVCYFMVANVKQKFGYDDSLDAFGVHGCGGTWARS